MRGVLLREFEACTVGINLNCICLHILEAVVLLSLFRCLSVEDVIDCSAVGYVITATLRMLDIDMRMSGHYGPAQFIQ